MRQRYFTWTCAVAVGLGLAVSRAPAAGEDAGQTGPIRIGVGRTLFKGVPEGVMLSLMDPFSRLMESQTGLKGRLIPVADSARLARMLADGEMDLGVFYGIEFAWARQAHPDLHPLMIAVNQERYLRALVVVPKTSKAAGLADLKGKALAMPRHSREHCRLYLERRCREEGGKEPRAYFSEFKTPANVEDILDDVADGKVAGALVEEVCLKCFQRRKPGRHALLKVAERSEVFPASVIAYREGTLDRATLKQFRAGMLRAHKMAMGRHLLTLWKLTQFQPVPEGFPELVEDIVKVYPPPQAEERKSAEVTGGGQ